MMKKFVSVLTGAALLMFVAVSAQATTMVDLELSLLVDVSGSVSTAEYKLQKQGYVDAFNDAGLQAAMVAGHYGKIAVNYIEWSGGNQQSEQVGFTLIDSSTAAGSFATAIQGVTRAFSGSTAPGSAIAYATPLFAANDYDGTRLVIDVSGDGSRNSGVSTSGARDAALNAGVDTINGIVIGGGSSLLSWYTNNVIGGTDAFALQADSFSDFGDAIKKKLRKEIVPTVPEPSTWVLMVLGLGGLVLYRRKKSA